ncbi:hypothetical protein F5Y08DRAFT_318132 [Xylaria arbuscula]|nr:hypothetical protein F5Y08DRAFT_318132 [Xylaria arbuscula]
MYNMKNLILFAGLVSAVASATQQFPDPTCGDLASNLIGAAPTTPPLLSSYFDSQATQALDPGDLLRDAPGYVKQLCGVAASAPQSVLAEFQGWGSSLLDYVSVSIASYDEVVTKCIATDTEAASITSYIHEIAASPGRLCQPTSSEAVGNATASVSAYPTATGNSTTTSITGHNTSIPIAAAPRLTAVLASAAAVGIAIGAAIAL